MVWDHWRLPQMVGLCLVALLFGYLIGKKYSWFAGAIVAYCLGSAAIIMEGSLTHFGGGYSHAFGETAGQAFAAIVMSVGLIFFMEKKYLPWAVLVFQVIALIDCVLILTIGYGIFNSESVDASFIMLIYPSICLIPLKPKLTLSHSLVLILTLALPIAALVAAKASTPYFMLSACLCAYILIKTTNPKRKLIELVTIAPIGLALGYWLLGRHTLIDPNGRVAIWQICMEWWAANVNIWIGYGSGTFEWLGYIIQKRTDTIFIWMHNEYLQILFEHGIIGFVIFLGLAIECLYKSRKNTWVFVSLIALSVCFISQFPLRWFVSQVWICLIVRIALGEKKRISA